MKETDLYGPVRDFLEQSGYEVQAEVKGCDVVAIKGDELVVIELKTGANMQLLIQATDRQRISESVYVAIPEPNKRSSHFRGVCRVLRKLELGLITVALDSPLQTVAVEFDPLPYQSKKLARRKRAVIQEVADRSASYNEGGSTGRKLMTAYRENAIFIACCLEQAARPMKPAELRALGTGQKTTSILSANHYGWFQRVEKGIYQLTDLGQKEIHDYPELRQRLLKLIQ